MLTVLKDFFRNICLKKHANRIETGIVPISSIRSATVLINASSEDFRQVETEVKEYFRQKQIGLDIIYIDIAKYKKGNSAVTAPEFTIYRKDLNWLGKPSKEKSAALLNSPKDIFICLTHSENFTERFISAVFPAKFKIGCSTSDSDPFNIVVSVASNTDAEAVKTIEIFKSIKAILESIR